MRTALPTMMLAALAAVAAAEEKTERGTIGTAIDFERHVEEFAGGRNREPLVPFSGTLYLGTLWRDVRQGQAVYSWRERRLYLIHDFFCTSVATGATMPYTCEAAAMIVWAPPPDDQGLVVEKLLAELKGDFGDVEPHPTLPIFAALRWGWCDDHGGWCDEGALVSVHDLSGRLLCRKAAISPLFVSSSEHALWSQLKLKDGEITCPNGTRARVPSWKEALRGTAARR